MYTYKIRICTFLVAAEPICAGCWTVYGGCAGSVGGCMLVVLVPVGGYC